jgi:hypothetical protein
MDTSSRNKKRWISLLRVISILLLAAFVACEVSQWRPKAIRQVSGTVISYKRTASKTGGMPMLVVKLDSNKQILTRVGGDTPVHIGARAVLTETETWPFGLRRYGFVGYVGATDPRRDKAGP